MAPASSYMPDKLPPKFRSVPEMNPGWNQYMKSVTEWYESMGYPGFNPFLPRARSRSPRHLKKRSRSRSRSASSGRKRKQSVSPENDRRSSRSREFDARGGDVSSRWRSRELGSRHYGTSEKEVRPLKQSPKMYSSKQGPKLESRAGRSGRVEKLKGREYRPAEASTKDKALKKDLHTKYTNDSRRLPKSEDKTKQTESVQRSMEYQQSSREVVADDKSGTRVKKLSDLRPLAPVQTYASVNMPAVQQNRVVSLLDLQLPDRYPQSTEDMTHNRKVISESVPQKDTFKVEQKRATATTQQTSHLKLDRDKTALASKKADKTTPPQSAVSGTDGLVKKKVETLVTASVTPSPTESAATVPPLLTVSTLPAVPKPKPVFEKPLTMPLERVMEKEEASLPASIEHHESGSKMELEQTTPQHTATDKTAPQQVAVEKTEVSTKNIAQVKPLLVASVPEKSRWERETEMVSESHDLPVHAARDRDRAPAAATSLPR